MKGFDLSDPFLIPAFGASPGAAYGRDPGNGGRMVERDKVHALKRALQRAQKGLPLKAKCLDLAIACKFMLRLRRIQSTVYLGVSKDEKEGLLAHAWVRSGKTIVTGSSGMEEYKVISSFA